MGGRGRVASHQHHSLLWFYVTFTKRDTMCPEKKDLTQKSGEKLVPGSEERVPYTIFRPAHQERREGPGHAGSEAVGACEWACHQA